MEDTLNEIRKEALVWKPCYTNPREDAMTPIKTVGWRVGGGGEREKNGGWQGRGGGGADTWIGIGWREKETGI